MKDKDGVDLKVGDLVIYVAKDKEGYGALFEGRIIAATDAYVVVDNEGSGAYVVKYSSRVAFLDE